MAAQPSGDGLVPDEFDVLVAREAQGHDKGPGAAYLAGRVAQHRSGTEVDLGGFTGGKGQPDRGIRHLVAFERAQDPAHAGVAAAVAVVALEGGVDDDAGNSLTVPNGNLGAQGLQTRHRGAGAFGIADGSHDRGVVRQNLLGRQPVLRDGQKP